MEFILIYRTLQERGVSAENIDAFAQAFKKWIATGARPLIYDHGLVYYTDGMLCSMPFEVRNIKPVGIEINGVFYVNRCLEICFNRDFPAWDAQFVFATCPQVDCKEVPEVLQLLKRQIFAEPTHTQTNPKFALELPTTEEMCALTEVIHSELDCQMKNFFINHKEYWLRIPQSGKVAPFSVSSPYLPAATPAPTCYKVKKQARDYTAMVLPVVHQGPHTFIGKLTEFEVPNMATLKMYQRLTGDIL